MVNGPCVAFNNTKFELLNQYPTEYKGRYQNRRNKQRPISGGGGGFKLNNTVCCARGVGWGGVGVVCFIKWYVRSR